MWTIIEIKQNYDHRKELFVGGVTTLQKKKGNICLETESDRVRSNLFLKLVRYVFLIPVGHFVFSFPKRNFLTLRHKVEKNALGAAFVCPLTARLKHQRVACS